MLQSYIGTQSDKLDEAMTGMYALLNKMPESAQFFEAARTGVLEQIRTQRYSKSALIFYYLRLKNKYGLDYDIRKDTYDKVQAMTMTDLRDFHTQKVANKNFTILVLGDKNKIDLNALGKYGTIKYLTLEEIFGY